MAILPTSKVGGVRYYDQSPPDHVAKRHGAPTNVVVLVHGLGSSLDFWNAVAPEMAKAVRTVAFDVPGFGESDSPSGHYNLHSVARSTTSFFDHQGLDRITLVGHSLGAILALRIAADRPDIVKGLILVDPTLLAVEAVLTKPSSALASPRVTLATCLQFVGALTPARLARQLVKFRRVREIGFSVYVHSPATLDVQTLQDAVRYIGGRGAANVIRVLPAARSVGLANLMATIRQPVTLVWGDYDPLFTESDRAESRRMMKVLDEFEIEDCGHMPMLERPIRLAHIIVSSKAAGRD